MVSHLALLFVSISHGIAQESQYSHTYDNGRCSYHWRVQRQILHNWLLRNEAPTGRRLRGSYFPVWKNEAILAEPQPQADCSHEIRRLRDVEVSCYV